MAMTETFLDSESRAQRILPPILFAIPADRIREVHSGLEGDWSPSATVIWRQGQGRTEFGAVVHRHPVHRPSLELYLDDGWIGLPCFLRVDGIHVFDAELAIAILDYLDEAARDLAHAVSMSETDSISE
jgi:hypothetical protein